MSYPFAYPPAGNELPPLRIHHFMLWTAVSAVMLTVMNTETPTQVFSTQTGAVGIPNTLIGSLCLTGLMLGLYWNRRGCRFFVEPGQIAFILHSLWVMYGLASASITAYLANGDVDARVNHALSGLLGVGGFAITIATLVLYFKYANKFKHYGKWGMFFKAVGILTILQFVLTFLLVMVLTFSMRGGNFQYFLYIPALVPFVLGIVEIVYWVLAVREDMREKVVYHWTHWVGISTWPALKLASLVTVFYFFLSSVDVFITS